MSHLCSHNPYLENHLQKVVVSDELFFRLKSGDHLGKSGKVVLPTQVDISGDPARTHCHHVDAMRVAVRARVRSNPRVEDLDFKACIAGKIAKGIYG